MNDEPIQVKDYKEALLLFFDGELIERYNGSYWSVIKNKVITKNQAQTLYIKLNNNVLYKWEDEKAVDKKIKLKI